MEISPSNFVSNERVFKKELIDRGWNDVEVHLKAQIYQKKGNLMIAVFAVIFFLLNCKPIDKADFQLPVAYLKHANIKIL